MVKFKIITKQEIHHEICSKLINLLTPFDEITIIDPDFIIVVGGDGTILKAENAYPLIPKITFRSSDVGSKCMYSLDQFEEVISKVLNNKYDIIEEPKIYLQDSDLFALNEIQLHNDSPISAVRFSIKVDNVFIMENIIGDGVIIATSFGSTGYYESVGGKSFENHIGIALNNPSNKSRFSDIFSLDSEIKITLHRKNGIFIADNNPDFVEAEENKEYIIKVSKYPAKFVEVK